MSNDLVEITENLTLTKKRRYIRYAVNSYTLTQALDFEGIPIPVMGNNYIFINNYNTQDNTEIKYKEDISHDNQEEIVISINQPNFNIMFKDNQYDIIQKYGNESGNKYYSEIKQYKLGDELPSDWNVLCIKKINSARGCDQIYIHKDLYRTVYLNKDIPINKLKEKIPQSVITDMHPSLKDDTSSTYIVQKYYNNIKQEFRIIVTSNLVFIKERKRKEIGALELPDGDTIQIKQANIKKEDPVYLSDVQYEYYTYDDLAQTMHHKYIKLLKQIFNNFNTPTMAFDIITYTDSDKFSILEFSEEFGMQHMTDEVYRLIGKEIVKYVFNTLPIRNHSVDASGDNE